MNKKTKNTLKAIGEHLRETWFTKLMSIVLFIGAYVAATEEHDGNAMLICIVLGIFAFIIPINMLNRD